MIFRGRGFGSGRPGGGAARLVGVDLRHPFATNAGSGAVHSQFGFGCLFEEKLSRLLLALALAQQLCGPTKRRLWSVCAAAGCPLILRSHGEGEACQSNLRK